MVRDEQIVTATRLWVEQVVVGLNLCPFAKRELVKNRVRFILTEADTVESLLFALETELKLLNDDASIETTLLIHPNVLQEFYAYNQFLDYADGLLQQMDLHGTYQVASFHPDYQFAGTEPADAENYTNRSPYPLLHLLREKSLNKAIDEYPDVGEIPERNIELMNQTGSKQLQALLDACLGSGSQDKS